MTRINLIPVEELSDQHLIAEYRELPRCIKQDINTKGTPNRYCLGVGHMKWAKHHSTWLINRYEQIVREIEYRGFTASYSVKDLIEQYNRTNLEDKNDYIVHEEDLSLSRNRILEKINMKPNWYRWAKRTIPEWVKNNK